MHASMFTSETVFQSLKSLTDCVSFLKQMEQELVHLEDKKPK